MMTAIAGIVGAAVLFGIFAALRPRDRGEEGCTGNCIGCTRNGACKTEESDVIPDEVRDLHLSRSDSSLRSE